MRRSCVGVVRGVVPTRAERMSEFRDMALDAGYRGEEADRRAAMLEQEEMAHAYAAAEEQRWLDAQEREHQRWIDSVYEAEQHGKAMAEALTCAPVHDPPMP